MSTRKSRRAKAKPTPTGPTTEINIANVESMLVGTPMPRRSRGDWKDCLYVVGALVGIAAFVAPDLGVRAHESVVALVAPHAAPSMLVDSFTPYTYDTYTYDTAARGTDVSHARPSYGTVIPYGGSSKPTHRR